MNPCCGDGSRMTPFLTLVLAGFLSRVGYQMARSPVLPRFAQDLGAAPELIGLIVAASTVTGVLIKLPAGALSDVLGRKRMMLLGCLFFAGPPFLYPFVESPGALLALRFLHGFATAIFSPVASAFVADLFQRDRGATLGWFASANDPAATVGPGQATRRKTLRSPRPQADDRGRSFPVCRHAACDPCVRLALAPLAAVGALWSGRGHRHTVDDGSGGGPREGRPSGVGDGRIRHHLGQRRGRGPDPGRLPHRLALVYACLRPHCGLHGGDGPALSHDGEGPDPSDSCGWTAYSLTEVSLMSR